MSTRMRNDLGAFRGRKEKKLKSVKERMREEGNAKTLEGNKKRRNGGGRVRRNEGKN